MKVEGLGNAYMLHMIAFNFWSLYKIACQNEILYKNDVNRVTVTYKKCTFLTVMTS